MSRSYRKTPIRGWTCSESEKYDKQLNHRRERKFVNQNVMFYDEQDWVYASYKMFSDPCSMDKDGRFYFNPEDHPHLMRK